MLVGEIDGELAGLLTGSACRDDREEPLGEVHGCYVDPAHWRKGVGSALMATAIERLTQAGHSEAVLWVLAGNSRARAFYEAHGWVADGAEKTYDLEGGRYPEVRYRRNLGSSEVRAFPVRRRRRHDRRGARTEASWCASREASGVPRPSTRTHRAHASPAPQEGDRPGTEVADGETVATYRSQAAR